MKKKRIAYLLGIVSLLVFVFVSVFLVFGTSNQKKSSVTQPQKIALFVKPTVARIYSITSVNWNLNETDSEWRDVAAGFLASINYNTGLESWGSGSFIDQDGYILTNAHVVSDMKLSEQELAAQSFDFSMVSRFIQYVSKNYDGYAISQTTARQVLLDNISWVNASAEIRVLFSGLNLLADIKSYGAPLGEGKDVAVIKVEGENFPTIAIGNSKNVQLQDNVWVFGFPGAGDSVNLEQASIAIPSITSGTVSATEKKSEQGSPIIQIDAATTHGNSGGPVVNEKAEVIGILTFRGNLVNDQEVQGFNFVVPTSTIQEYIKQSGANINQFNEVNNLYIEGLELYWQGYYKDALKNFEEVRRIFPNHSEISKLIKDSQKNIANSRMNWRKYKQGFFVVDGIALLLILVFIYLGFIKKEKTE